MRTPEFRGSTYRQLNDLAIWTSQRKEQALEPDLPIIDAHHHLWDDERGRYAADDFMADVAGGHNVVATVYMQHKAMYRIDGPQALRPVGEVEYINGIAAASASGRYGTIRLCEGIVAHADLTLGDEVQPVLEALTAAGNGRLRGVRHVAAWDGGSASVVPGAPRHLLQDEKFQRGLARLQSMGLSYDTYLYFPQLDELARVISKFPDLRFILNHVGGPLGIAPYFDRDEVFAAWKIGIGKLARFPNLDIKLGGLGMLYSGRDYHLRDTPPASDELAADWRPYIETCIEAFGPSRCMLESNFPVDKQSCGYDVLWNAFKRITAPLSQAEKLALYHDTAVRAYRLPRDLKGS